MNIDKSKLRRQVTALLFGWYIAVGAGVTLSLFLLAVHQWSRPLDGIIAITAPLLIALFISASFFMMWIAVTDPYPPTK